MFFDRVAFFAHFLPSATFTLLAHLLHFAMLRTDINISVENSITKIEIVVVVDISIAIIT